jgi:DNA-binding winged helix-turn-helix (wHTH) protein
LAAGDELSLDPLRQSTPLWRGKRVNLPLTAQRILAALYEKRGEVVSYDELSQVVKSGRNRDNIRKHISTIREAFRELDEDFDRIENIPMRGFRWSGSPPAQARLPQQPGASNGEMTRAGLAGVLPAAHPLSHFLPAARAGRRGHGRHRAAGGKAAQLRQLSGELRQDQGTDRRPPAPPGGQLALLNPPRGEGPVTPLRPVMLPFSAIDFDDQNKVRHAVEMAGCLVQYKNYGSLCVAIANNPWAGGFIYAAGTFVSGTLVPHRIGDEFLDGAHRLRVVVSLRGQTYRWLAPFEVPSRTPVRSVGRCAAVSPATWNSPAGTTARPNR